MKVNQILGENMLHVIEQYVLLIEENGEKALSSVLKYGYYFHTNNTFMTCEN